jgi:hypothetical protein
LTPFQTFPHGGWGPSFKNLSWELILAKEPDCWVGFSPLGETGKGVNKNKYFSANRLINSISKYIYYEKRINP